MSFYPRHVRAMSTARRHRILLPAVLTAGLAACALAAAPAVQAANEAIVKDCLNQGYVDPDKYSRGELQDALDGLPSDIAEYTECYDVILDALDAKKKPKRSGGGQADSGGAAGGAGGGSGGAGGGGAPSIEDTGRARNEIESTLQRAAPKVGVGGEAGVPKLAGVEPAAAGNELPLPILLALIAVALTLATGGLLALRSKLPGLRRALGNASMPSFGRGSLRRLRR
jgi:hypothetical protein